MGEENHSDNYHEGNQTKTKGRRNQDNQDNREDNQNQQTEYSAPAEQYQYPDQNYQYQQHQQQSYPEYQASSQYAQYPQNMYYQNPNYGYYQPAQYIPLTPEQKALKSLTGAFWAKWILSLVFGIAFLGVLVGTVGIIMDRASNPLTSCSYGQCSWMQNSYIWLISSLLITGAIHLVFAYQARNEKYGKVIEKNSSLSAINILFSCFQAVPLVFIYLGSFIGPFVGLIIGLPIEDTSFTLASVVTNGIGILVSLLFIAYTLNMKSVRIPRAIYLSSILTLVIGAIVAFAIIPASQLRNAQSKTSNSWVESW